MAPHRPWNGDQSRETAREGEKNTAPCDFPRWSPQKKTIETISITARRFSHPSLPPPPLFTVSSPIPFSRSNCTHFISCYILPLHKSCEAQERRAWKIIAFVRSVLIISQSNSLLNGRISIWFIYLSIFVERIDEGINFSIQVNFFLLWLPSALDLLIGRSNTKTTIY